MSCRETKGGTIALRLARLYSGLPDTQMQKLFHALQREGKGLPDPSENDLKRWHARQRALLRHADMTESVKSRSEHDLFLAKAEKPDGALFHALSRIELRARQESILQSITTAVDLDPPGSQAAYYDLDTDGRPKKVWYASYGSNMNKQRFLTYIEGGKPEGTSTTHYGARDETPPTGDIPIRFDGRMHFAYISGRWGNGGVAFMDVDHAGHALGRAYQITAEQFDDVVAQENGRSILGGKDLITPLDKVIATGREDISKNLYGTLIHVGDYQACPVFTFTGAFTAQQALEESALYYSTGKADLTTAANKPSGNYLRMVAKGLEESFGMTEEEQVDYLRGCGGAEEWTRRELLAVLRAPEPEPLPPVKSYSGYGTSTYTSTSPSTPVFKEPKPSGSPYTQPTLFPGVRMPLKDSDTPTVSPLAAEPAAYDWRKYSQAGRVVTVEGSQPTSVTPPTRPIVYTSKPCPVCGKTGHTMHDCPELISPVIPANKSKKQNRAERRRKAKKNHTAAPVTIIAPSTTDVEQATRQILLDIMGDKKLSRSAAQKLLNEDTNLQADVTVLATSLATERQKRRTPTVTTPAKTTPAPAAPSRNLSLPEPTSQEWQAAEALAISKVSKERNISRAAAWDIVKKDPTLTDTIAQRLVTDRLAASPPVIFGEQTYPPHSKEEAFAAGCTEQEWKEAAATVQNRLPQRHSSDDERATALLAWSAARRAVMEQANRTFTADPTTDNPTITIKTGERVNLNLYLNKTIAIQAKLGKNDYRTYTGTLIGLTEPVGDTPDTTRFIIIQDADGKNSHLNPSIIDTIRQKKDTQP